MAIVNPAPRMTNLPPIMSTRLDEVRRREASLRLIAGLLDALALFLAALFVMLLIDWALTLFSTPAREALTYCALGTGAIGVVVLALVPWFKRRTLAELAAKVDQSVPGLEERWETVTRLKASADPETIAGSPVLIDRLVAESIERENYVDPQFVVSGRSLRKHQWLLAAAVAANLALFLVDPAQAWVLVRRFCSPTTPVSLTELTAAPGDVAVPRGEPVRLEATLAGRGRDKGELFLRSPQGQVTTLALVASDGDGKRFAHAIDAADEPFSYRFRAGDGQTAWHSVTVYDRPRLMNVELKLQPPDYTRLPAVTKSELPTSLRAVEGSQLEIAFSVNQPLDHFDLQLGADSAKRLSPHVSDPQRYVFQTKLDKTLRLTPVFVNAYGLSNVRPPSCQIIVYPDRRPEVTIITPEREISLRATDQVTVEFAARDDFGVVRAELVAFVGDQPDLQNARVISPPAADAAKTAKTASAASNAAAEAKAAASAALSSAQRKATEIMAASAAKAASSSPPSETMSTPATDQKPDAEKPQASPSQAAAAQPAPPQTPAPQASAPPQTIVMPIPLAGQTGEKNVRGKVKLDLRQFQLKEGQQLQYMVRVYDSRSARSNGQSYGDASKPGDAMASQQDAKNPAARSTRAPSNQTTSKETPSEKAPSEKMPSKNMPAEPRSERIAEGSKDGKTAPRPGAKMAKAADRKAAKGDDSSRNAADRKTSESASSQSPERSAKKETKPSEASKAEMTGAPRPEDTMPRQQLDVDSQSTASSTMKIHIDKWAGSFDGQQRRKLEILIDPVLKDLDAALAKALDELRPVSDALAQSKKPADDLKKPLRAADTQIARGQSLVADLVQKTDGTPYAFIGLQLVDITELHLSPARLDVKAAKTDAPDRKERVQQAEVHLTRAREMLADLTRKYESVKRDLRLADDMQRIKMMYQVFIEDSMAFLAANRGTLNPKNRKMAQLELDEEFLKQYRELVQEWEKTLAELAKALAKDPRLLARYMNLSRRRVDSLRDQMTLLNLRQQELLALVQQMTGTGSVPTTPDGTKPKEAASPRAAGEKAVRATLSRDLAEIVGGTIGVQEDLGTWLPQKSKDEPQFVALREQAARISSLATMGMTAAGNPNAKKAAEAARPIGELATQLKTFEAALVKLANGDDQQLSVPLNRRLARVRTLEQLTSAWTEKNAHMTAGRLHRALEMDQHRLSEDTLALTGKLETAAAQLAGLPDDVLTLADEVKDALRYDVLVEQMQAELRLRDADLVETQPHQKTAIEGFARAEERFNKLIDRVIEEQDKVPPQVPDLDNMQLPTLEELLARLESETDLAELLGIPDRPSNLQALRGWLPGNGGSGSGSGNGMMAGARDRARLADEARKNALRAARNAGKADARPRPAATAAHWNTLGSRLEDAVRQGRGSTPPRQYRRAIERYFELISGAKNTAENAAAAVGPKENGKETSAAPNGNSSSKP